ncbi:MAG TPA: copper homeostasis protein CutC [Candidatus Sulfotelmatobacter sp.]|jgi:copper homeostasis protein|nr:copper homeostasis protein CutC [Candidatus Sulfotelmatobacter sp.]
MNEQVLIEVCVDSVASAVAAERGGAGRVELCSSLIEGGVTPSTGLIEAVRARISIGLQVIIRPRGGDFCYSDEEIAIIERDIATAKNLGVDGVVLGVLDQAGHVSVQCMRQWVELARPLNVTFHRAFDMSADLFSSMDDVCATGADRILTSGGEQTCLQAVDTIARLVKAARGRITILAGGGITHNDAAAIIERTGVSEIHVGLSSPVPSPMLYRNPRVSMGKTPGREYQRMQVLEENVRKLQRAISVAGTAGPTKG